MSARSYDTENLNTTILISRNKVHSVHSRKKKCPFFSDHLKTSKIHLSSFFRLSFIWNTFFLLNYKRQGQENYGGWYNHFIYTFFSVHASGELLCTNKLYAPLAISTKIFNFAILHAMMLRLFAIVVVDFI